MIIYMKQRIGTLILFTFVAISMAAGTINVVPGSNAVSAALSQAQAGDVLVLADGEYQESSKLIIDKSLTVQAAEGAQPIIYMTSRIETSTSFKLQGVELVGSTTEAIRMIPGSAPYTVIVKSCTLQGYTSKTLRVYNTDQTTPYVDSLIIDDCIFRPAAGRVVEASVAEKQVANLSITNSTFDGGSAGIGRLVYFLSTEGTTVESAVIDHCTFYNAADTRGIYLGNIDGAQVSNCIFMNPEYNADYKSYCVYGKNTLLTHSISYNADPYVRSGAQSTKVSTQTPYFVDAANGNFQLYKNSPAATASIRGTALGDPRWGVSNENMPLANEPYKPHKMPYSMAPTTSSIRILWQMAEETEPTTAIVWYGTNKDNLSDSIVTDSGWMVEDEGYMHIVDLAGLEANTRYYFQVGDAHRRCDAICSTHTAPEVGTAYRIFTISDIHGNSCNNWSNMQDFICNLNPQLAMMNGDIVSDVGADRNWNSYFFRPGEQFLACTPTMSSAGNHETGVPSNKRWSSFYDYFWQFSHGESEDSITDPRGEAYFSFPYGNAQIIAININGDASSPEFLPGSKQYQWLDQTLEASTSPWIFIFGHVGIYTSGYHGQWSAEPKQVAPLLEKHAAAGKRIIYFCGDDHSFEHLYKDGVHYVRPGCGRNSNYAQQTGLIDAQYSMFYRKISCFSTIDMAADAKNVQLTAYDSVGNMFYQYDFLLEGNLINPKITFTEPLNHVEVIDSVSLRYFPFDPQQNSTIAFYYTQANEARDGQLIQANVPAQVTAPKQICWHTREVYPKGDYHVYAIISNGNVADTAFLSTTITIAEDTIAPPAPTKLLGTVQEDKLHFTWENPNRLVTITEQLADFTTDIANFQAVNEEQATAQLFHEAEALRVDFNVNQAWATASVDYVFDEPLNTPATTTLSFRFKGDGTNCALRLVVKNMSNNHEDWWYTEQIYLTAKDWDTYSIYIPSLSAFDWYSNNDTKCRLDGLTRICFCISPSSATAGSFWLDDIQLTGEISPAKDFQQTVIIRNEKGFALTPTDGIEIYRGADEACIDATASLSKTYYYAAFAADDRGNWSLPAISAQWKYPDDILNNVVDNIINMPQKKILKNHQLLIYHDERVYNILGTMINNK